MRRSFSIEGVEGARRALLKRSSKPVTKPCNFAVCAIGRRKVYRRLRDLGVGPRTTHTEAKTDPRQGSEISQIFDDRNFAGGDQPGFVRAFRYRKIHADKLHPRTQHSENKMLGQERAGFPIRLSAPSLVPPRLD